MNTQLLKTQVHGKSPSLFEQASWMNMLIHGDNLSVLNTLTEHNDILGHVRMIYIDPPFATGQEFRKGESRTAHISHSLSDSLAYSDLLQGKEYLDFLKDRFKIAKELLAEDGSIYVHIDCKVGHYVKIIMDEVFGENNFINDITRIKSNPKNFDRKAYGNMKDMLLFYSKSSEYLWNGSFEEYTVDDVERLFSKIDSNGRRYTTNPLHAPGETRNGATGQSWQGYLPPKGRHWRYTPDVLDELDRQGLIERSSTGNPRKKIFADEFILKKKKRQDVWELKDPPYPVYPTEKNLEMMKVIITASSNPGDLILDYFAGSGTTLVAAEELDRRWIGIDSSPIAIDTTIKRLLNETKCRPFALYEATINLSDSIQELIK